MRLEFDLTHGLTLGEGGKERTLKHVVLRAPEPGDIIDAGEESEKLVYALQNGELAPVLVTSPTLSGVHVLRRQIVMLGDVHGPLDLALLKRLPLSDFNVLQSKAEEIDAAIAAEAERASQAVTQRGRDDTPAPGA